MKSSRREFIKTASLISVGSPLLTLPGVAKDTVAVDDQLSVHLFSKHLQFLDLYHAAEVANEIGFAGLDLTVRPKGHVLPENLSEDLPRAIEDIKRGGSKCEMITTAIESVDNIEDTNLIREAARLGVKYYRTNWFKYHKGLSMPESLAVYTRQIKELSLLNQELGIVGCYQNHAGKSVGASFWEIYKLLEEANTDFFGTQYDIRHAMAEGGHSWENGLTLLMPHLKVIVLKDFKWGKVNGKWKAVNVPIGQGMVDFMSYFKILKKHNLNPPVSLHLEYPLGGAEKGKSNITIDRKVVFDAMKKDLETVQTLWQQA